MSTDHQLKRWPGVSASSAALYGMYLDPAAHAAFTGGGPAAISPVVGSKWRAFDGRIHGRMLSLTPGRQIVQSWRSFVWQQADLEAVLVLRFTAAGPNTRVDLARVGVPDWLRAANSLCGSHHDAPGSELGIRGAPRESHRPRMRSRGSPVDPGPSGSSWSQRRGMRPSSNLEPGKGTCAS